MYDSGHGGSKARRDCSKPDILIRPFRPVVPAAWPLIIHAKNKIAGRIRPFLVLGFWDKSTGICAGAMPYRRIFQPLPGSRHFKLKQAGFLAWVVSLVRKRAIAHAPTPAQGAPAWSEGARGHFKAGLVCGREHVSAQQRS